jgi:hypothetical protein
MLLLERAARLKAEADTVLKLTRLDEILPAYGKVFPSGSYF